MSWSDRTGDPLPAGHPEARPHPSAGLLTGRFWREVVDRAVKTAAQAVLLFWGGGDLFNLWQVGWATTAGMAAGGAVLSVVASVASAPFGDRFSASAIRTKDA